MIPVNKILQKLLITDTQSTFTEQTVRILTPEEIEQETRPEYDEEDLLQLISFIKAMTTLYDLRESDWKENHDVVIREFFLNPKKMILTVYFDGNDLECLLDFPDTSYVDLTYFLRDPMEIFEVETFHDKITFGTVHDNVEGSILKVIENVYAQVFFHIKTWPDSIL